MKTYIDTYGVEKTRELAESLGSCYEYFYQIGAGFRRPSIELTKRLCKETNGVLTKEKLRPDVYEGDAA